MQVSRIRSQWDVADVWGPSPGRSPGLHLSACLRAMALEYGYLDEVYAVEEEADNNALAIALGCAWEDWYGAKLETADPTFHYHPGEIQLCGIAMTPDGISPNALHEIKCTKKSTSREIEKQWMWLMQVKCYLYALGFTECRFHVLHINGGYGFLQRKRQLDPGDFGPELIVYRLRFEQEELRDAMQRVWLYSRESKELGNHALWQE